MATKRKSRKPRVRKPVSAPPPTSPRPAPSSQSLWAALVARLRAHPPKRPASWRALFKSLAPRWTKLETSVFVAVSSAAVLLAFLYSFYMDRYPVFDEVGLANPIYTYLHTGHMTYPMHGYPHDMFIHPPTHYWLTAEFMKLGLSMFRASAAPVFLFATLSVAIVYTGRFSFTTAMAIILGMFASLFIWSESYTVRPDLHLTAAWFAGTLMLQAAKNCNWSPIRLLAGSTISTYAGTLHYWGTLAFVAAGVCAIWLFFTIQSRTALFTRLAALALGTTVVAGLYAVIFVIPEYANIRSITSGVQGNGSWIDAFERHRTSYAAFSTRLRSIGVPHLIDTLSPAFTPRWAVDTLLWPILKMRLPAVFVAVPLLYIKRETRFLAISGAIVPLFVLFYSQGKQIGYTGYFSPEIVLYLTAILLIVFELLRLMWERGRRFARLCVPLSVLLIGGAVLREVPVSMGQSWHFRDKIDVLDVNRAAASSVLGDDQSIALTSAGNWYTAGGTLVWNAYNDLYQADSRKIDLPTKLSGFTVVTQVGNWWNAQKQAAPVNDWYLDGRLRLRGVILNAPGFASMNELFLTTDPTDRFLGYIIGQDSSVRFTASPSGGFEMWIGVCPERPVRSQNVIAFDSFPVDAEPGPSVPHMVILTGRDSAVTGAIRALGPACRERDHFTGSIDELGNNTLLDDLSARDRPISFFMTRPTIQKANGK